MSKGVHNIAFYVSPDPECSRTTQNSEISIAPCRGRILYAIYGNSTCVINHIVVTAIDKKYHNYYVSTDLFALSERPKATYMETRTLASDIDQRVQQREAEKSGKPYQPDSHTGGGKG